MCGLARSLAQLMARFRPRYSRLYTLLATLDFIILYDCKWTALVIASRILFFPVIWSFDVTGVNDRVTDGVADEKKKLGQVFPRCRSERGTLDVC